LAQHQAPVGIVANPASGRDVRRLVARASAFPVSEKCHMITRLLAALAATGVTRVLAMPDRGGITERLRRAIATQGPHDGWPQVEFVEMPIEDGPADTLRAVELMVAAGVAAIVVLGGDGTHRLAASACGETPIMALSTGTNNVFPEIREATIAGIATGLVATGRVDATRASRRNKVLRVEVDGQQTDLAVVDAAISNHRWIGSKALWHPELLSQLFVTFAESDALGLSSIAGLLCPVSRRAAHGLRIDLLPPERAAVTLKAPIAPGLMASVGIAGVCEIRPSEPQSIHSGSGVIALDGEREIEFRPQQRVAIRLGLDGPLTIDTEEVMTQAARDGLLVSRHA